jgi:hypothetical protein
MGEVEGDDASLQAGFEVRLARFELGCDEAHDLAGGGIGEGGRREACDAVAEAEGVGEGERLGAAEWVIHSIEAADEGREAAGVEVEQGFEGVGHQRVS